MRSKILWTYQIRGCIGFKMEWLPTAERSALKANRKETFSASFLVFTVMARFFNSKSHDFKPEIAEKIDHFTHHFFFFLIIRLGPFSPLTSRSCYFPDIPLKFPNPDSPSIAPLFPRTNTLFFFSTLSERYCIFNVLTSSDGYCISVHFGSACS